MSHGVLQRAAVAILLMGTLVAPSGICQQQTHKAAHDCCASASQSSASVQNDCCTARTNLPAVVVPDRSGPAPLTVAHEFIGADKPSLASVFPALAVIPPPSPPTGASILRI